MTDRAKALDDILWQEYVAYRWTEVTTYSDAKRLFIRGLERTPEERDEILQVLQRLKEFGAPSGLAGDCSNRPTEE